MKGKKLKYVQLSSSEFISLNPQLIQRGLSKSAQNNTVYIDLEHAYFKISWEKGGNYF